MQAMAGVDPDDRTTRVAPSLDYLAGIERGAAGLRIAYLAGQDLAATEPAVLSHFEQAIARLAAVGATMVTLKLPRPLEDSMRSAGLLMSAESYRFLAEYVDGADSAVHSSVRTRILRGRTISAADYMRLLEDREQAQAEMLQALDRADALVAPTCPITAIPLAEVDEAQTPLSAYGRFVNFLDFASLSVPMGNTVHGLRTGLQIAVRRFDDPLALRIGRALERDAGFAVAIPPGFDPETAGR